MQTDSMRGFQEQIAILKDKVDKQGKNFANETEDINSEIQKSARSSKSNLKAAKEDLVNMITAIGDKFTSLDFKVTLFQAARQSRGEFRCE